MESIQNKNNFKVNARDTDSLGSDHISPSSRHFWSWWRFSGFPVWWHMWSLSGYTPEIEHQIPKMAIFEAESTFSKAHHFGRIQPLVFGDVLILLTFISWGEPLGSEIRGDNMGGHLWEILSLINCDFYFRHLCFHKCISKDTVDGWNPKQPPGMYKTL